MITSRDHLQRLEATERRIRNDALDEAIEAVMQAYPDRKALKVIGESEHYCAAARAIRALKIADNPQKAAPQSDTTAS